MLKVSQTQGPRAAGCAYFTAYSAIHLNLIPREETLPAVRPRSRHFSPPAPYIFCSVNVDSRAVRIVCPVVVYSQTCKHACTETSLSCVFVCLQGELPFKPFDETIFWQNEVILVTFRANSGSLVD